MVKFLISLLLSIFFSVPLSAQLIQKAPVARNVLADGVFYAETSNDSFPADNSSHGVADPETGTFTRISKHQDYGLTVTRLVVDLGEGSAVTMADLTEGSFEVLGSNKSDNVVRNITGLSVTDRKGDIVTSGRYVTIDLDFGFDSDADNAYTYIVTLNKDLGKCGKGTKFVQKGRTLRK